MSALIGEVVTDNARPPRETIVSRNVTDNDGGESAPGVSRNEDGCTPPRVIRNAYVTLAGFALTWDGGWVSCAECGGRTYQRHCLSCHQQQTYKEVKGKSYPEDVDHDSCYACGRCLPPQSRRNYCSTTCRVRTHNYYRHTAEGQAKRAKREADTQEWLEGWRTEGWETRRRQGQSKRYGTVCGRCGHEFADGEHVYRKRHYNYGGISIYVVCESCHRATHDDYYNDKNDKDGWDDAEPCEGCARPVHESLRTRRYHDEYGRSSRYGGVQRVVTCSQRCADRVRRSAARVEREPADCATCGERFDHGRRDSRYCSPACRQRAYRRRTTPTEAIP